MQLKETTYTDRREFVIEQLKKLGKTENFICLTGETNEMLFDTTKKRTKNADIQDVVLNELENQKKPYDMVISFDAVDFKASLIGENSAETFGKMGIIVKQQGNPENIANTFFDNQEIRNTGSIDRIFLTILDQINQKLKKAEHQNKKIVVVIDNFDLFVGTDPQATASAEKGLVIPRLNKLIREASIHENLHLVGIDRANEISTSKAAEIVTTKILPMATQAEIEKVIGFQLSGDLFRMAKGIPLKELKKMINQSEKLLKQVNIDQSKVLRTALLEKKIKAIEKDGKESVKCRIEDLSWDHIYINEQEKKYWQQKTNQMKESPDSMNETILLTGAPGVGKTLRARVFASQMGVPFLMANDTNADGLKGVEAMKVQRMFNTAIKHKPCVLFIDEVEDTINSTEGSNACNSNDDNRSYSIYKKMLGSPEMDGVLVLFAANDPRKLNEALTRSGRAGECIYIGVPETQKEQLMTFLSIKNQFPQLQDYKFDKKFLEAYIQEFPENITGADMSVLYKDAFSIMKMEECSFEEGLIKGLVAKMNKFANKSEKFHEFIRIGKAMHSSYLKTWTSDEKKQNQPPLSSEINKLMTMGADIGDILTQKANMADQEQVLENKLEEIAAAKEKLAATQAKEAKLSANVKGLKAQQKAITKEATTVVSLIENMLKKNTEVASDFKKMMVVRKNGENLFDSIQSSLFIEDVFEDHGNNPGDDDENFDYIPNDAENGQYIVLPVIYDSLSGKNHAEQQQILKQIQKEYGNNAKIVVPPISVLAKAVTQNRTAFDDLANRKTLRLWSSTIVPDLPSYRELDKNKILEQIKADEEKLGETFNKDFDEKYLRSQVGEGYEIVLNSPGLEKDEVGLLDINSGKLNDLEVDLDENMQEKPVIPLTIFIPEA